jgi:hypothetical protein
MQQLQFRTQTVSVYKIDYMHKSDNIIKMKQNTTNYQKINSKYKMSVRGESALKQFWTYLVC